MLDKKKIAMLRVLDGATSEWLPIKELLERVVWSPMKLKPRVREMEREGLAVWKTDFGKTSIRITDKGRDSLAVWDFSRHGLLDDIGNVVAEGKESVLVNATGPDGSFVIKFHRYDSAVFDRIKRSLAYMAIVSRLPLETEQDISRAKARIEYETLKRLHPRVSVPEPLAINRHAVAMEFLGDRFPAPLLKEVDVEPWMEEEVMDEYDKAVSEGIVHGDMSEYNVMAWEGELYIIDWPQSVPSDYEHAHLLEERDRERMASFFSKFKKKKK